MTGALDAKARATAERLINKFGKPITIRRTSSTYNPATGSTTETTADHSGNAAPPSPYEERLIDGSLIQVGDMRVTVPARSLSIVPSTTTDTVVMDGATWQLVRVMPLFSGELVATYELQVRK